MIKRSFICSAFCAVLAPFAVYSAPPHHPQPVATVKDSDSLEDGYVRLKISISNDGVGGESQVPVGNIFVCSDVSCYGAQIPNRNVNLFNTKDGKSEFLVQLRVPSLVVNSVHFEDVAGARAIVGDVNLATPLAVQGGVKGGEILVLVGKSNRGQRTIFEPISAVGSLYSPLRQSVYYNPKFSMAAVIDPGVTISIPQGGTLIPQIFSVAVHDTGDSYPLVDIFPEMALNTPASVSVVNSGSYRSSGASGIVSGQRNGNMNGAKKSIPKTGVIRFNDKSGPRSSIIPLAQPSSSVSALAATDTCRDFLKFNAMQLTASLSATGAVYIKGCETVPPYVHIVVANNADPRELLSLSYNFSGNGSYLSLKRIETWAPSGQVTINGFVWSGDSGVTTGTGLARGFVQNSSDVLGSNRVAGGTVGNYDTNKLVFLIQPTIAPRWREGSVPPLWTTGVDGVNYPYSVVSSSTSVVKNGVCSGDVTTNRWSAFGTTTDNRLIFVSSTSDGQTSAAELCSIFMALGANYAIRLDGSTAAGITIDGFRKNPITGANSFVYGSSRYIAYAMKLGYASRYGAPAATPVIEDGIVPPPGNPCAVNPRACQ